uniref:Uncharacterized protein n=1 Tax=Anguilla anguilla TaxID=7936 RepID=A0A0E9TYA5_ANGAN
MWACQKSSFWYFWIPDPNADKFLLTHQYQNSKISQGMV